MAERVRRSTFLDLPPREDARVVVLPVPYDSTTSYRSGARDGPAAIIDASKQLEEYDMELDRNVSTVGIHTAPDVEPDVSGPKAMTARVRRAVRAVVSGGRLPALLGGEHTIAVGAVQALAEAYPDLSVLYLDAHADLRDAYMGSPWGHASVARRLLEAAPVTLVGVRSMSQGEMDLTRSLETPLHPWPPPVGIPDLAEAVIETLSDNVYVSLDLDVLDPSLMPAVGTRSPAAWGGTMRWASSGPSRSVGA